MNQNLLLQVKIHHESRFIAGGKLKLGQKKWYLSTESSILLPGTKTFNKKGVFSF